MPDLSKITSRIRSTARDGDLDTEDVQGAVNAARADGKIDSAERIELQNALRQNADKFEPAARRYLEDTLAGKDAKLTNRVLLAPAPAGAQRDMYYARTDVVALQESLVKLGISTGTDGDYGPGTVKAVKSFQQSMGVQPTGVVDSATLQLLNDRLEAKGIDLLDLSPRAAIRPDTVVALKNGSNTADNQALQLGLARLGEHFGFEPLKLSADGKFDERTEAAVKAFQQMAYLPETGIVDRTTLDSMNAALGAVGLDTVKVKPPAGGAGFKGQVELHFYPGDQELKLYVMKDGKLLDTYGMVGGNNQTRDDPNNPTVDFGPSPKGKYKIVEVSPHTSGAWSYSYVPYGAQLREQNGEVQFRDGGGQWKWATGPQSVFKGRNPPPLERAAYQDRDGKPMKVWTLNDFGHLRGRLKSIATGNIQGHMIHSSPDQERASNYWEDTDALVDPAQALGTLHHSHGCEHIQPRDMDELVAKGYLAPGTNFVIHGYDESFRH
jgi:peptidoglycan hydrolase-like protein with peptidoglycan-binding domain